MKDRGEREGERSENLPHTGACYTFLIQTAAASVPFPTRSHERPFQDSPLITISAQKVCDSVTVCHQEGLARQV